MKRTVPPEKLLASRPIKPSLGVLGQQWALLIVTDIGFRNIDRFNRLLASNRGLTPRMLSRRLCELEEQGILFRKEMKSRPKRVIWALTPKGIDMLPFLMQLTVFSARWNSEYVFKGKMPTLRDKQ